MKEKVLTAITETGLVAIMRGLTHRDSLRTAEALIKGGVKAIEVTFNTKDAESILKDLSREFGSHAFIGAGTVITEEQLAKAVANGASFILSPNFDRTIVSKTIKAGLVAIPGAFTPSEVFEAHRAGASIVKVFPVSSVGPQYIKDLKGPFDNLALMPVGGVNLKNAYDFIKAGSIALGVGSSLIQKDLISQNRFPVLTELASSYLQKVREARL